MAGVVLMGQMLEQIRTMLETVTSRPFGNGHSPALYGEPMTNLPFGIIYRVVLGGGGLSVGSVGWPDDAMRVGVQVSTVGLDQRQATSLLDSVRTAMLERGATGFTNSIDATGAAVIDRRMEGFGVTEEEGDFVTTSDRFELLVVATT